VIVLPVPRGSQVDHPAGMPQKRLMVQPCVDTMQ
jgi:hypothetical protein